MSASHSSPRVTIFGPDPLLSITIEARDGRDDMHIHAAGQGVWVARMAAELGAWPILCGLSGGETGAVLAPLLDALPGEARLTTTGGSSGSYVVDRRTGSRQLVAASGRPAPERHEIDDMVATTCAAALRSAVTVACNPYPADGFPDEVYETLVGDVRASGIPVLVDLSSPRLERTLPHEPNLVKLNDWELAEYVRGPVDSGRALGAACRLQAAGAQAVMLTRAEKPILVLPPNGEPYEIVPPAFPQGFGEGCGDTMMGAIAAAWARGLPLQETLILGAAAGSGNFLRHGLGSGRRAVVEEIARTVELRPVPRTSANGVGATSLTKRAP